MGAADSTLAPYAGTWSTLVDDTPMGTIQGMLTVERDGTGVLSIAAMNVWDAAVTGLSGATGALVGASTFTYSVSGQTHTTTITLAPSADDTLSGTIDDSGVPYGMTARRADP